MLTSPTNPENTQWSNRRIFLLLAVGTLIVSVIWHAPDEIEYLSERAGELILTLVIAMSLTYLLRPGVNYFHRLFDRKSPDSRKSHNTRVWATLVIFLICGLIIWLFCLIGLKPVIKDVHDLWDNFIPQGAEARREMFFRWKAMLQQAIAPYQGFMPGVTLDQSLPLGLTRAARWVGDKLTHTVSPGFIVELILVPVLVFYFLTDGPAIRAEARLLAPANWRPRCGRMLGYLDRVLDGYIRGQVIMCLIAWVLTTVALALLGVPHAVTLGLVAGLTRAVPVIGPLLGGIPVIVVCLITTQSMNLTLTLLIGFTAMHFIESKVLLPKIVGHEVDLHPVSVIVSILIGMKFFGFLGVFLAVPIAAVMKIILAEWHDTQLIKAEDAAATDFAVTDLTATDLTDDTIQSNLVSQRKELTT